MTRILWALLATIGMAAPAAAARLPQTVLPDHYDIHLAPDFAKDDFQGEETISVRLLQPGTTVVLNAAEIEFLDTTITAAGISQRARVSLDPGGEMASLTVPMPIPAGPATIHIRFTGRLNSRLRGFYLSRANGRKYAVTQFEATDARRAFPCFDEPALKATFALSVTVDQGDTAISNGRVLADTPGPDAGTHTLRFSTTKKMSSYLVAVAVGDWQCIGGSADEIPIRVCATPDKKDQLGFALEAAQVSMRFFNRYFSITYPYEKLDLLGVPDFAAGAMENTGAIFFRDRALMLNDRQTSAAARRGVMTTVSHEMAHHWFGDLVTMRWWDDIWLNEGFASWMEQKPMAEWKPEWNVPLSEERATQGAMNLDALRSTRAIRTPVDTPDEINQVFDGIAYQKTAAVLRMLELYVGADTFRSGVNAYLQKYAYGNATGEDFWTAITAASGKPVDVIMSSFVVQKGLPLVTATPSCSAGRTHIALTQEQLSISPSNPAPVWQIPVCFRRPAEGRVDATACEILSQPAQVVSLDGCAPWLLANANGRGYYRLAYDADALKALGTAVQAGTLTDVEEASLLDDTWALVRVNRENVRNYLALMGNLLRAPLTPALSTIMGRLDSIGEDLVDEVDRPAFQAWVRTLVQPVADTLGPDPSPQEDDDRRSLRASVLYTLGYTGADQDLLRDARRRVDVYLDGGGSLDPSLVTTVVNLAALEGDAALYQRYQTRAESSNVPGEQLRFRNALVLFRDPALRTRTLEYATSAAVRRQDQAPLLAQTLSSPASQDTAWAYVKANWGSLEASLDVFQGLPVIVRAAGNFCSVPAREDVRQFFESHRIRGTERAAQQALETIDTCIAIKTQQGQRLSQFLRSPAPNGN